MASRDAENNVYRATKDGLTRWLKRARDAVMTPFERFRATPSADAVYATVPAWQNEVDRILAALTPALHEGWVAAHLPHDFDPNDPYVRANLALTHNLLVRIPDEVHALVVAEVLAGTNANEDTDQIAQRIDNVLTYTGSENWDARARLIAQTETTRHYNSSLLAHGLLVEREDGTPLVKEWQTLTDGRERREHLEVDHQRRPLSQPYLVDGALMMFPGDPTAPAHLVCNCRCGQTITKVAP